MTIFKRTTCVLSLIIVIAAYLFPTFVSAAEPIGYARFLINGSNSKINLTSGASSWGGNIRNIWWGSEEERKQSLSVEIPLTGSAWQEFSFSFTPDKDGMVQINLIGEDKKGADGKGIVVYTFYDDISVTGAELSNGDFESFDKDNPVGWWFWSPDEKHPGRIVCDPKLAHGGKYFAAAWHRGAVVRQIKVKANQELTISGFAIPVGTAPSAP
jgi:hypothetical protein